MVQCKRSRCLLYKCFSLEDRLACVRALGGEVEVRCAGNNFKIAPDE